MQAAQPREFGRFQPRNGAERLGLRAIGELGLETHHVVERAQRVVLAQLHDGAGLHRGIVRIGEADRLHRAVAQGLAAALRHHLDRQAAVEIGGVLEILEGDFFAFEQGVDEGLVLLAVERTIDVVRAGPPGPALS